VGRSQIQLSLFENARRAAVRAGTSMLLALTEYDKIIVFYSGGKDRQAALLYLLELGIEPARIE
jgi:hypothetical protein